MGDFLRLLDSTVCKYHFLGELQINQNLLCRENVVLGEYDTRTKTDCVEVDGYRQCAPPAKSFKVQRAFLHPGWRERQEDDIALLRLDKRVQFNGMFTALNNTLNSFFTNYLSRVH